MAVGELHQEFFYASTGVYEIPWAVHEHTKVAAANGQMRIVNDGAQDGLYTDIGGGLGFNTPTAPAHFVIGSFIVVEPIEEYPGLGRWQVAIIRTNTTEVRYLLAPDGGWSSVDVTAGNNYGFGDGLAGSNVITDLPIIRDAALSASGSLRLSSCNLDTYDSGTKRYTYLRIIEKPTGTADSPFGLRVGGFVPTDIASETKPIVALARRPHLIDAVNEWAYTSAASHCRTPYEYPPRTLQMNALSAEDRTVSAVCVVEGPTFGSEGFDRSGQLIGLTIRLVSYSDQKQLGSFGPNDMKAIDNSLTDWDDDGVVTYFNLHRILFRWAP